MKNKNKKETAQEVLSPVIEKQEQAVAEKVEVVNKKKRYHKKPKAVVVEPVAEELTPVVVVSVIKKKNWIQRQVTKFLLWYNA